MLLYSWWARVISPLFSRRVPRGPSLCEIGYLSRRILAEIDASKIETNMFSIAGYLLQYYLSRWKIVKALLPDFKWGQLTHASQQQSAI